MSSKVKKAYLYLVVLASFSYNFATRICLQTGYLSASASVLCGVLAMIAIIPTSKRFVDTRLPRMRSDSANSFDEDTKAKKSMDVVKNVNLALSFGTLPILSSSFIIYIIISSIVKTNKGEYVSTCVWYLFSLPISMDLTWAAYKASQSISFALSPGFQDQPAYPLWIRKAFYFAKLTAISIIYLLFFFTLFDSGFRANGFVQYYAKADMQLVLDTALHFDCYCAGIKLKFQECLSQQRGKPSYARDNVFVMEHGLGSNTFIERSLLQYTSTRLPDYVVCGYNRRQQGWSDRMSYADLQSYPDVSENTKYLVSWITSQKLNSPIIYAGHSYGGLHMVWMATRHPSLVRGLIFISSSSDFLWPGGSSVSGAFSAQQIKPFLNCVGLLTGLPMVIASSFSLEQLISTFAGNSLYYADGAHVDSQSDTAEMVSSLMQLNFVEPALQDDYLGFSNSIVMIRQFGYFVSTPSLFLYEATNYPYWASSSKFTSSVFRYQVNETTHAGIVSQKWTEVGDQIALFLNSGNFTLGSDTDAFMRQS